MSMALSSLASQAQPTSHSPDVPDTFLGSILHGNPIFSAGFGLMVMGGALAYGRSALRWGASAAQRRMLVSLEIPSKDRAHPWFLHWMGAQAAAQALRRKANHGHLPRESILEFLGLTRPRVYSDENTNNPLRAATGEVVSPVRIVSRELAVDTQYDETTTPGVPGGSDRGQATFSLVPGPGTHWFRYKGVWMRLQRERNGKLVDQSTGAP